MSAIKSRSAIAKSKAPPVKSAVKRTVAKSKTKAAEPSKEKNAVAARKGTAVSKKGASKTSFDPHKLREQKFAEVFGPVFPKGRALGAEGETLTPDQLAERGWSIMQFAPKAGRLSWLYVTNGLSALKSNATGKPTRIELVLHWRDRDLAPLRLLAEAVRAVVEGAVPATPGHLLSSSEGLNLEIELIRHCVTLDVDPLAGGIDLPGGTVTPLLLLGISDAEHELALKVRPELADGRHVLMEALRMGGIYPVSDPKRLCLTRRRDFHRLWENAFRAVRERKA